MTTRRDRISTDRDPSGGRARGFSLAEMLFAVFILGIGVISISALFPVGLTQQRRSVDAIVGPTIANNAMEILRAKLSPDDFGLLNYVQQDDPYLTIHGDFTWRRPAFYTQATTVPDKFGNNRVVSQGSIDIFYGSNDAYGNALGGTTANTVSEVPYSLVKYAVADPPHIVFTQEERYWPQQSATAIAAGGAQAEPPQYVWDCAFRRFQGRILVAIFVYRVDSAGGQGLPYMASEHPNNPAEPPIPLRNLLDGTGAAPDDPWAPSSTSITDARIPGTDPGVAVNPFDPDQAWQAPGQWVLDQNNNVHRVLSGRRNVGDGPVELTRPVPLMPSIPCYSDATDLGGATRDPVIDLWYLPAIVSDPNTGREWNVTPVYVTVREL